MEGGFFFRKWCKIARKKGQTGRKNERRGITSKRVEQPKYHTPTFTIHGQTDKVGTYNHFLKMLRREKQKLGSKSEKGREVEEEEEEEEEQEAEEKEEGEGG